MPVKLTDVQKGKICPYCRKKPKIVKSEEVYGKGYHYGYIAWCKPCDAYVGCHRGTKKPKGSLANREARKHRVQAHRVFDPLWKEGLIYPRNAAYTWLAEEMGIHVDECHIAMFDREQLDETILRCKTKYRRLKGRS